MTNIKQYKLQILIQYQDWQQFVLKLINKGSNLALKEKLDVINSPILQQFTEFPPLIYHTQQIK